MLPDSCSSTVSISTCILSILPTSQTHPPPPPQLPPCCYQMLQILPTRLCVPLLRGHQSWALFWPVQVFSGGSSGKESLCQCRRHKRLGFDPWVGKIPWRRAWQPTPAFLPGEFHGQRSLVGYSPWSHKESDITEATQQACAGLFTGIRMIFLSFKFIHLFSCMGSQLHHAGSFSSLTRD